MRAASLQADGLKAIGQMYSTLAAGAMAGVSAQDRPPVWFDDCMTPRKNRTNAIQRVCHVRLQTTTRTG